MGRIIPNSIKVQVLVHWLSGISRDDIALNVGISTGSVSHIIKECQKGEVVDIDLLRPVAVKMKNQGLELKDLASSISLRNMLVLLELPEEKVEKFLLALSIYNYKNDIENPEKFIDEIIKFSEYVASLDISVFNIVNYIEEMKTELKKLNSKIFFAKMDLGSLEYHQEEIRSNMEKSKTSKALDNNVNNE
jgi:hypothetical protein